MFTGIVQAVGEIVRAQPLEVDSGALRMADVGTGDSICVQGVCLTVTSLTALMVTPAGGILLLPRLVNSGSPARATDPPPIS